MPPIQQQSSRAGLISTIVVLTVLLVGTLIWAFLANTQLQQAKLDLENQGKKYSAVVRDIDLAASQDTEASNLRKFKTDLNIPGTLMDAAAAERQKLFDLIKGSDETNVKAGIDAARSTVGHAIKDLHDAKLTDLDINQPLPLVSTIADLAKTLIQKQHELEAAVQARDAAVSAATAAAASQAAALKERDGSVAQATQRADEAEKKLAAANAAIAENMTKVTADQQSTMADMNTKQQQLMAQVAQLNGTITHQAAEIKARDVRLNKYRFDPKDVMIRRGGVHILRVENATTVYVDAGFADRVNPGLSFEVYGKNDGVPKLGDGMSDENLPEGKASIEIVKVGENSSEARVVRVIPGQLISEGDICCNIAYDRTIKPGFMVYGNFDMDFNGVWTAGEADVVKSLVKRFGGVVNDKISIDTDFLVLGKEPEVPQLTKDEASDPVLQAKQDAAKVALKAYEDVRSQAAEFHIPVLNQSRFLYYTGYFDLAKR